MKKLLMILLPVALLLGGCAEQTLDFQSVDVVSGKVFKQGDDKPFTGTVTDFPFSQLPTSAIQGFLGIVSRVTGNRHFAEIIPMSALSTVMNENGEDAILCSIHITAGMPDGEAVCRLNTANKPFLNIPYKSGVVDGALVVFDLKTEGERFAEANFVQGKLDGKASIRDVETGKGIYQRVWNGADNSGYEILFDKTTGNLISRENYVNGKKEGEVITYAPDGTTPIHQTQYHAGKLHGLEIHYSDGKPFRKIAWVDDLEWDGMAGFMEGRRTGVNPDGCVDQWVLAYWDAVGEDKPVTADQLAEWLAKCGESGGIGPAGQE